MKEEIMRIIAENPGVRKRHIAHLLGVWQCDHTFLRAMIDLEKEGLIFCRSFSDPANMEYYDKWYLSLAAIMKTGE